MIYWQVVCDHETKPYWNGVELQEQPYFFSSEKRAKTALSALETTIALMDWELNGHVEKIKLASTTLASIHSDMNPDLRRMMACFAKAPGPFQWERKSLIQRLRTAARGATKPFVRAARYSVPDECALIFKNRLRARGVLHNKMKVSHKVLDYLHLAQMSERFEVMVFFYDEKDAVSLRMILGMPFWECDLTKEP